MKTHLLGQVARRTALLMALLCGMLNATAQNAALYGTSVVSSAGSADWYFIGTSAGLMLSVSNTGDLQALQVSALTENTPNHLWSVQKLGGTTYLINKGITGGFNASGTWDYTQPGTVVTLSASTGGITVGGKALQLTSDGATLADGTATALIYVKAPVGEGTEWVQLESYRSARVGATFLQESNGKMSWTATNDASSDHQAMRLVYDASAKCYYMMPRSMRGSYLHHAGLGNNDLTFSTAANLSQLVIQPCFDSRAGYVNLGLKRAAAGDTYYTFDFSSGALVGFYSASAFLGRPNDGFKFVMLSYSEGLYDALNAAISVAESTLNAIAVGTDPGTVPQSAADALREAVARAKTLNGREDLSSDDIDAAVATLNAAVTAFRQAVQTVKYTVAGDTTWYYILSASTSTYCRDKAIVSTSSATGKPLQFDTKRIDPNMAWCFVRNANTGKVAIRNMATGRYFANQLSSTAGTVPTAAAVYTIAPYSSDWYTGTAFTITSSASQNPIHAQQNGSVIVTWAVEQSNPSSLWRFEQIGDDELNMPLRVAQTTVGQGRVTTGIGNHDLPILQTVMTCEGMKGSLQLQAVKGTLQGTTDLGDVTAVKVYAYDNMFELNPASKAAHLLGTATPQEDGTYCVQLDAPYSFRIGKHYLWVALDIAETAQEGHLVDATIHEYVFADGTTLAETAGNPEHAATIFLTEATLLRPGDYDSRYYRIPAITKAVDGTLVAITDKRWNSEVDLPNNIDIVAQTSRDNGKTWSEPQTIAGTAALGGDYGHGDAAIVTDLWTGDIFVMVVSKQGYFNSTPDNPALIKIIVSHDNGRTWDAPLDITDQIYGANCSDATRKGWYGMFMTSGAMLQMRDGTLVGAASVRMTSSGNSDVVLIYSQDHGKTWTASTRTGTSNANESKVIERQNGSLYLSVRHPGYRYKNVTSNLGKTWSFSAQTTNNYLYEPGCNGDMIRLTWNNTDDTHKSRLLHSIPWASNRSNVSVLASYDEGNTWKHRKTICPRGSAYSALTVLDDGTIGCYYEENGLVDGYVMRYVRFSLDWLTGGADALQNYVAPTGVHGATVSDDSSQRLDVRVQNGRIQVPGHDRFAVTSLSGITYPQNVTLAPGIYIVSAGGRQAKVVVE